jgi:hypothetical protein
MRRADWADEDPHGILITAATSWEGLSFQDSALRLVTRGLVHTGDSIDLACLCRRRAHSDPYRANNGRGIVAWITDRGNCVTWKVESADHGKATGAHPQAVTVG